MPRHLRSADEFLNTLGLRARVFQNLLLEDLVRKAHHFAAEVWENPQLSDFADHGINHSYSDLAKALELLRFVEAGPSEERLSDLERVTLCLAALFHDVGMQWNKYHAGTRLSDRDVRAFHIRNGDAMLRAAMGQPTGAKGFPSLEASGSAAHILDVARKVGLAHSGDEFWSQVTNETRWNVGIAEQQLRPQMLAAAFRLADEIDNASDRVLNVERLFAELLTNETAAHWGACHYIHDVRVITGRAGIQIELVTRVPTGASGQDRRLLRLLIEELRVRRINEERNRVEPYLRPTENDPGSQIRVRVDGPLEAPEKPIPEEIKEYVREHFETTKRDTPPGHTAGNLRIVAGANSDLAAAARALDRSNEHGGAYDSIHVALRTGWHSNRYYWTERLLPGMADALALVRGLAVLYADEGLTDILAIGTSGVRIASQLSLVLGAQFNFTFPPSIAIDKRTGRQRYLEYERQFALSAADARVLVVDDILGVGAALQETVAELRALATPPAHIRAFCLLSLGREKPAGLDLGMPVDVLLEDSVVRYWPESADELCDQCRDSPSLLMRED